MPAGNAHVDFYFTRLLYKPCKVLEKKRKNPFVGFLWDFSAVLPWRPSCHCKATCTGLGSGVACCVPVPPPRPPNVLHAVPEPHPQLSNTTSPGEAASAPQVLAPRMVGNRRQKPFADPVPSLGMARSSWVTPAFVTPPLPSPNVAARPASHSQPHEVLDARRIYPFSIHPGARMALFAPLCSCHAVSSSPSCMEHIWGCCPLTTPLLHAPPCWGPPPALPSPPPPAPAVRKRQC